jgi:hypothetical protein
MRFQRQDDLDMLLEALSPEQDEERRKHALTALAQRKTSSREIVTALLACRDNDPSPEFRAKADQALTENVAHRVVLQNYAELQEAASAPQEGDETDKEEFNPPLKCMVCGRQDETVRIAVYPYVYSLLVVTYRRHYAGVWCGKHRRQKQLLAGLITALGGWWGLPFGFIYTPKALYQIARGHNVEPDLNAMLLRGIANARLAEEDVEGALRCLEASLQLEEKPATQDSLKKLRSEHSSESPAAPQPRKVWVILRLLLFAALLGLGIGGLDTLITFAFTALIQGEVSLLVGMLTWTPLITMLFLGGVFIFQRLEKTLTDLRCCNSTVGALISVGVALLTLFSILEGSVLTSYTVSLIRGDFFSTQEAIGVGLSVATLGVPLTLIQTIGSIGTGGFGNLVYLILLGLAALFYAGMGIHHALRTTQGQRQLVTVQENTQVIQRTEESEVV